MTATAAALRVELETALLGEYQRVGERAFRASSLIRQFLERGVPRATAYRWVREAQQSGRLGQHLARSVRASAEARAMRCPDDPSVDAAREAVARLPVRASIADVSGQSPLQIRQKIASAIADVDRVRASAMTDDDQVQNPRLLLNAVEVLRRCLETATRITRALHDIDQIEKFHTMILEEIARETPECAARIAVRIEQVATEWGG